MFSREHSTGVDAEHGLNIVDMDTRTHVCVRQARRRADTLLFVVLHSVTTDDVVVGVGITLPGVLACTHAYMQYSCFLLIA